jgi:hypothetical protein
MSSEKGEAIAKFGEKLSAAQANVLVQMHAFFCINPKVWVSWVEPYGKGRLRNAGPRVSTLVALNSMGLLDLNHFIGYRLTKKGLEVAEHLISSTEVQA